MGRASSQSLLILGLVLYASLVSAQPGQSPGVPPVPSYTLMPRTATSVPLGTVNLPTAPAVVKAKDFAKLGYVEEEYLLKGTADLYKNGIELVQRSVPYVTRMLLVRPADPKKWSGDIQLTALRNATEMSEGWKLASDYMLEHGDIWVGLTVSNDNVARLHNVVDKARYAELRVPEDGFRYDLMMQVAWLLRSPEGMLAKAGFSRPDVKVISSGWSMNGSLQVQLMNGGHHARARTPSGGPLIDGYIPGITAAVLERLPSDAAVIRMNSEEEVATRGKAALTVRQPDSSTPTARFRHYDIATTVHGGSEMDRAMFIPDYQLAGYKVWSGLEQCRQLPVDTRSGKRNFARAMYANMSDWLRKNVAPPPGRVIEVDAEGKIVRDADGFARGGLRPYWTVVPTSRIEVLTKPGSLGATCVSYGSEERFPAERLKQMYPTTKAYVSKVSAYIDSLVKDRYLRARDAKEDLARVKLDLVP